jgi:hypothetical protein
MKTLLRISEDCAYFLAHTPDVLRTVAKQQSFKLPILRPMDRSGMPLLLISKNCTGTNFMQIDQDYHIAHLQNLIKETLCKLIRLTPLLIKEN